MNKQPKSIPTKGKNKYKSSFGLYIFFIYPPPFSFLFYHKSIILSSEIFGFAECEIIYSVNCEISHCVRCEMKQIPHTPAGVFHMAKPYFTHEVHFTNPVRDLFR